MEYRTITLMIALHLVTLNAMEPVWVQEAQKRIAIVEAGADKKILDEPYVEYGYSFSLLHAAAYSSYPGYKIFLNKLLDLGADPNIDINNGMGVPLNLTTEKKTIEALLKAGADPRRSNCLSEVFVHYSSLKHRKKSSKVSDKEWFNDQMSCLNMLVDAGADVNKPWRYGYHPIYAIIDDNLADIEDKKAVISFLVSRGCDLTKKAGMGYCLGFVSVLEYYEEKDQSWFAFLKECEKFKQLTEMLHKGVQKDSLSEVQAALAEKVGPNQLKINVDQVNTDGESPLVVALTNKSFKAAEFLIEHGAQKFTFNNRGKVALSVLKEVGNECPSELLKKLQGECPICLEDIEEVGHIYDCGHAIHQGCKNDQLKKCPLCRDE